MVQKFNILIIGFSVTMLFSSLFHFINLKEKVKKYIEDCRQVAMMMLRWIGLAYIFATILTVILYPDFSFINRATGPYAWAYWLMLIGIIVLPQLYWIKAMRKSPFRYVIALGLLLTSGAFMEQFVLLIASLDRDHGEDLVFLTFFMHMVVQAGIYLGLVLVIRDIKNRISKTPKTKR